MCIFEGSAATHHQDVPFEFENALDPKRHLLLQRTESRGILPFSIEARLPELILQSQSAQVKHMQDALSTLMRSILHMCNFLEENPIGYSACVRFGAASSAARLFKRESTTCHSHGCLVSRVWLGGVNPYMSMRRSWLWSLSGARLSVLEQAMRARSLSCEVEDYCSIYRRAHQL